MPFDLLRDNPTVIAAAKPASLFRSDTRTAVRPQPVGGTLKRAFDFYSTLVIIAMLSPLLLGLALVLRLTDKGPLLYGHKRIGFDGETFHCWKFRSMAVNGDEILEKYLRENPDQRDIWEREFKLENDPRVTAVGAVLRATSLDELPQLLNVLKGDMSLVGPRPVVAKELVNYGNQKSKYLAARPGITGLWQVSGRSDTSYAERVALDGDYVANWSLMLDLKLLFKTVPAVALAKGAR